jgi:hypothetical protein
VLAIVGKALSNLSLPVFPKSGKRFISFRPIFLIEFPSGVGAGASIFHGSRPNDGDISLRDFPDYTN